MIQQPNADYRQMQQAFIDEQWDNTTALYTIQEQAAIGSSTYNTIQVWIDFVVGATSRGLQNGDDFRKLVFQEITHDTERGRMYSFDDNIWINKIVPLYGNIYRNLLNCWKTLRALMLKRKDETSLNVNA